MNKCLSELAKGSVVAQWLAHLPLVVEVKSSILVKGKKKYVLQICFINIICRDDSLKKVCCRPDHTMQGDTCPKEWYISNDPSTNQTLGDILYPGFWLVKNCSTVRCICFCWTLYPKINFQPIRTCFNACTISQNDHWTCIALHSVQIGQGESSPAQYRVIYMFTKRRLPSCKTGVYKVHLPVLPLRA